MCISTLINNDLNELRNLQPDGWPDIIPEFEFYIKNNFCYPIKKSIDNKIVGVGDLIVFGDTSWLAHIIVSKEYRNKGIGYELVKELLNKHDNSSAKTCLLIATELGMPIYKKFKFKSITDYAFLKREKPWPRFSTSSNLYHYQKEYLSSILDLDINISGENREKLLSIYLNSSLLYVEKEKVKGFYIPELGEGPIVADNPIAGLELMKIKYAKSEKAVLPSENIVGIEFLKRNGFEPADTKGIRMILGDEIDWKPENIFSRIGGNYG